MAAATGSIPATIRSRHGSDGTLAPLLEVEHVGGLLPRCRSTIREYATVTEQRPPATAEPPGRHAAERRRRDERGGSAESHPRGAFGVVDHDGRDREHGCQDQRDPTDGDGDGPGGDDRDRDRQGADDPVDVGCVRAGVVEHGGSDHEHEPGDRRDRLGDPHASAPPRNARHTESPSSRTLRRCCRLASTSSIAGGIMTTDTTADTRHSVQNAP